MICWSELLRLPQEHWRRSASAMTRNEAHAVLFKGQANVAKTAVQVGCSTESLKESFAAYAVAIPKSDDAWKGDIELGWPWS